MPREHGHGRRTDRDRQSAVDGRVDGVGHHLIMMIAYSVPLTMLTLTVCAAVSSYPSFIPCATGRWSSVRPSRRLTCNAPSSKPSPASKLSKPQFGKPLPTAGRASGSAARLPDSARAAFGVAVKPVLGAGVRVAAMRGRLRHDLRGTRHARTGCRRRIHVIGVRIRHAILGIVGVISGSWRSPPICARCEMIPAGEGDEAAAVRRLHATNRVAKPGDVGLGDGGRSACGGPSGDESGMAYSNGYCHRRGILVHGVRRSRSLRCRLRHPAKRQDA